MLQAVVHDEAHERLPVHDQALLSGFRGQIRLGLAGQGGVVAEQPLVVVGVDEHRVQCGGVLLARAHHLFAPHLLLGLFRYLDRRDGRVEHPVGCAFKRVFHLAFEPRKKAHGVSLWHARAPSLILGCSAL